MAKTAGRVIFISTHIFALDRTVSTSNKGDKGTVKSGVINDCK